MGGKVKKSVKKFSKEAIGRTIKNRKAGQQIKRRKETDRQRTLERAAFEDDKEATVAAVEKRAIETMDMDAFLDGGFENLVGDQEHELDEEEEEDGMEEESSDAEDGGDDDDDSLDLDMDSDQEDDEEESDEDLDGAPPQLAAANQALKGEAARHKSQLEALRSKDPEFYDYLMQSDKNLLTFGQGESDDEDDDGSEEEESEDEEEEDAKKKKKPAAKKQVDKKKKKKAAAASDSDEEEEEEEEEDASDDEPNRKTITLTSSLIDTWIEAALQQQSLHALRHLLKAFRLATHYGEGIDDDKKSGKGGGHMALGNASSYNKLMLNFLQHADEIFRRMLIGGGAKDSTTTTTTNRPLTVEAVMKSPRYKKLEPLLKSYLGNTLHLVTHVTDGKLVAYILRHVRPSTILLAPYSKLARKWTKATLRVLGEGENVARVQAALLIREMGLVLPPPSLETCLRGVVRTFLSHAKFHSPSTHAHRAFLMRVVGEVASIAPETGYLVAFSQIRQLAVVMKNALSFKTKEAYKEVYNWQYVHSLELWARVIAGGGGGGGEEASGGGEGGVLTPLVYPLVQLALGAARLVPTPRYFPLRLRIVRILLALSQSIGCYIPLGALLLEVLQFSGFRSPPSGTGNAIDLGALLRVAKPTLRTTRFQEELLSQTLELLCEHVAQHAYHVAFPEVSHLILLRLRHFAKHSPVDKFRRQARTLAQGIERNVQFVGVKRDRVEFSPKDAQAVAAARIGGGGGHGKKGEFLAAERAKKAAPLEQLNAQWRERAQKRAEALRADAMTIGEEEEEEEEERGRGRKDARASKRPRDDEEDDEEEEEDDDDDDEDDDDEVMVGADDALFEDDDGEEGGGGGGKRSGKKARGTAPLPTLNDGDEDLLEALVDVSDSDSGDDDAMPQRGGGRGRGGGFGGRGGGGGGRGRGGGRGGRGGGRGGRGDARGRGPMRKEEQVEKAGAHYAKRKHKGGRK